MKIRSVLLGTLILGSFSMLAVGCKTTDSNDQQNNVKSTVNNLSVNSASAAINTPISGVDLQTLRAGVGCVNDQNQAVIDPDLRTNDSASKEIKYGRINDVITKTIALSFLNQTDGKLHVQEKLVSVVSDSKGDLQQDPVTSTMTCDPQLPLSKACTMDVVPAPAPTPTTQIKIQVNGQQVNATQATTTAAVQSPKKDNICQILSVQNTTSNDFSGTFTLQNGLAVKALRHVQTISGDVTCGNLKFGKGTITEETVLTRDVVAVSDLVACGGAPVLRLRTVTITDGSKVIQSQRSEILSAPKR